MTERDDQFYDLGYATPEAASEIRSRRTRGSLTNAAGVSKPSRVHKGGSHVRNFESDRDHPEMAQLPPDFVDDDITEPLPPGLGRLLARISARRAKIESIVASCDGNEALAKARVAAYIAQHGEIE